MQRRSAKPTPNITPSTARFLTLFLLSIFAIQVLAVVVLLHESINARGDRMYWDLISRLAKGGNPPAHA